MLLSKWRHPGDHQLYMVLIPLTFRPIYLLMDGLDMALLAAFSRLVIAVDRRTKPWHVLSLHALPMACVTLPCCASHHVLGHHDVLHGCTTSMDCDYGDLNQSTFGVCASAHARPMARSLPPCTSIVLSAGSITIRPTTAVPPPRLWDVGVRCSCGGGAQADILCMVCRLWRVGRATSCGWPTLSSMSSSVIYHIGAA